MKKKIVSIFLVVAMIASLGVISAVAVDDQQFDQGSESELPHSEIEIAVEDAINLN